MEKSRKLFSTGKNQNTKQNIDNGRLNLTTFEVRGEIPWLTRLTPGFYHFIIWSRLENLGLLVLLL